jgi:hypothetical protein
VTRIRVSIEAELDLDEEAMEMFDRICAESPGEEQDWLADRIRDEQHVQVQSYDLTYDIVKSS